MLIVICMSSIGIVACILIYILFRNVNEFTDVSNILPNSVGIEVSGVEEDASDPTKQLDKISIEHSTTSATTPTMTLNTHKNKIYIFYLLLLLIIFLMVLYVVTN